MHKYEIPTSVAVSEFRLLCNLSFSNICRKDTNCFPILQILWEKLYDFSKEGERIKARTCSLK